MILIEPRFAWGPRYSDGGGRAGHASAVVIHHTVTGPLSADASPAEEVQHMRYLESVGQARFGQGISYNVLVFPSGRAYQGVSFGRLGAHTGGHNSTTRAICFVGNFEREHPTDAAVSTAARIVAAGRGTWWDQHAAVRPHSAYKATACPGAHLAARIDDIRDGTTTEDDDMTPEDRRRLENIAENVLTIRRDVQWIKARIGGTNARDDDGERKTPTISEDLDTIRYRTK